RWTCSCSRRPATWRWCACNTAWPAARSTPWSSSSASTAAGTSATSCATPGTPSSARPPNPPPGRRRTRTAKPPRPECRYRPGLTRAGGERVIQPARRRLPPLAAVGMIGLRGAAARTIRTPGVSPGPDQPDGRRLEEKGQNTPLPRKRGKAPVHAEKDQDTLPPPRAGRAGVGAASDRRARRSRVGLAPIPTFPRKRGKGPVRGEKVQTRPPSPACGGGLGWGPHQRAALDDFASDTAPIPTFPRKRGKAPVRGEKGLDTPPSPACGAGPGGGPHQIAALDDFASDTAPNLSPQAGEGAGARREGPRHAPLPRVRGRAGVGA